jgi:hypothetical protein
MFSNILRKSKFDKTFQNDEGSQQTKPFNFFETEKCWVVILKIVLSQIVKTKKVVTFENGMGL